MVEKWYEVFKGVIPKDNYQVQLRIGEVSGLTIELRSDTIQIVLSFGAVRAIRMLDEGLVQGQLYSQSEVQKFKKDGFKNVVYEVTDGEFKNQIRKISDGFVDALSAKHYVIITQNYNIDIVTEWTPEIRCIR